MRIALIGKAANFCAQLERLLVSEDYAVSVLSASQDKLLDDWVELPHLLVLLPAEVKSAVSMIGGLRRSERAREIPILCVGPNAGGAEGVRWLDAGADDFMNRPFHPEIFLARVRSLLRRWLRFGSAAEGAPGDLRCGKLSVQLIQRQVRLADKPVPLTRLEFDLLVDLIRHADQVRPRKELLGAVWKYPDDVETRTLEKHVETLRRKLGECGSCIQAARGIGYAFFKPRACAQPTSSANH